MEVDGRFRRSKYLFCLRTAVVGLCDLALPGVLCVVFTLNPFFLPNDIVRIPSVRPDSCAEKQSRPIYLVSTLQRLELVTNAKKDKYC